MGTGYDDMIGCASCSLSQRLMQQVWLPCFILVASSCFTPHVCLMVVQWTYINSVDTFLYPYALPLINYSLHFLKSLPKCNLSLSLRSLQALRLNNTEVHRQQIPWSQVWFRRQEIPQQQVLARPSSMKEVERTNVVMVCPNQKVRFTQHNLYIMDIDCGNRNCYNCRGFGYLARNCRNKRVENRIGEKKRLEYGQNNGQNNLNGERDLIVFNQILVKIGLQYLQEQQIIHPVTTLTMETY